MFKQTTLKGLNLNNRLLNLDLFCDFGVAAKVRLKY